MFRNLVEIRDLSTDLLNQVEETFQTITIVLSSKAEPQRIKKFS